MENVIPHAFATTWQASMEEWGTQIKSAVVVINEDSLDPSVPYF
jgi:hypothetical protein